MSMNYDGMQGKVEISISDFLKLIEQNKDNDKAIKDANNLVKRIKDNRDKISFAILQLIADIMNDPQLAFKRAAEYNIVDASEKIISLLNRYDVVSKEGTVGKESNRLFVREYVEIGSRTINMPIINLDYNPDEQKI